MTNFKRALLGIATLLTLGLYANPTEAAALRTFVSSTGNDANTASNCAATTPCRTLAAAFSVTAANGHIFMTDVAGYGTLTITRSVTLVAIDGALIGVPSGGTGITINAGVNDTITIDGLTIDGAGVGQDGITFNTGRSLTITNSIVRGMTNIGIVFEPNATSALQMSNTVVANNAFRGISMVPTGSGTVTASLSRVELYNNVSAGFLVLGAFSTGLITAVIADSVAANTGTGFAMNSSSAATRLMLIRSVSANNATGLLAIGPAATLRVGQSTLTGNTTSWQAANSATLRSYADNNIDGNADGDPAPTAIAKK